MPVAPLVSSKRESGDQLDGISIAQRAIAVHLPLATEDSACSSLHRQPPHIRSHWRKSSAARRLSEDDHMPAKRTRSCGKTGRTCSLLCVLVLGLTLFGMETAAGLAPGRPSLTDATAVTFGGGPVSSSDIQFLNFVELAGLWEGSVSTLVAARTLNPSVAAVARQLASDHEELDVLDARIASDVGVVLPTSPTQQQQQWVSQILSLTADAADRTYVNLVRAAHGTVFQVISSVRATTQNDEIRAFAQTANDVVMRHMTLLEGTDLAQTSSLMVDPFSTAMTNQPTVTATQVTLSGVVACAMIVATLLLVRRLRIYGRTDTQ